MSSKTRTRITEELHFDVDGGYLKLRIFEKQRLSVGEQAVDYRLESQLGASGQYATYSFPIGSPQCARLLSEALARTADRMEVEGGPIVGGKYPTFRQKQPYRHVMSIKDGMRARDVFEERTIISPHDVSAHFLGIDWLDEKGNFVRFEPLPRTRSHGAGGSMRSYLDAEVGMTLKQAREQRKAQGLDQDVSLYPHPHQIEVTSFSTRYVKVGADPAIFDPLEDFAEAYLQAVRDRKEAPGRSWDRNDFKPMTDEEWAAFARNRMVQDFSYIASAYRWTPAGANPKKFAAFVQALQGELGVNDDIVNVALEQMPPGPKEALFRAQAD